MQGAQSPDEITTMNSHNISFRKQFSQNVECFSVVRVVKRGYKYDAIRDIEVAITGGEPLAFKDDWRRHRQFHDAKRPPSKVASLMQALKIFLQWQVILI